MKGMIEMPCISVIVPVYNVEDYLRDCVDSIINQNFTDFEVLLINDGSTDQSGSICREYAQKDSRIRVIEKANGGLSDARNVGLQNAKGKYVSFIDSDDYVSPNYLYRLLTLLLESNSDISQISIYSKSVENKKREKNYVLSNVEALHELLKFKKYKVYSWGKLYKISLFDGIMFPVGKLMEDSFTTYKVTMQAKKIICSDEKLYFYRQRSGSIMNSSFNEKKLELLKAPNLIRSYLPENVSKDFEDDINYYTVRICVNLINQLLRSKDGLNSTYIDIILNKLISTNARKIGFKYELLTWWIRSSLDTYSLFIRKIDKGRL